MLPISLVRIFLKSADIPPPCQRKSYYSESGNLDFPVSPNSHSQKSQVIPNSALSSLSEPIKKWADSSQPPSFLWIIIKLFPIFFMCFSLDLYIFIFIIIAIIRTLWEVEGLPCAGSSPALKGFYLKHSQKKTHTGYNESLDVFG